MSTQQEYIPGQCNIGNREIRARIWMGIAFSLLTIASSAILVVLKAPPVVRALTFFPAMLAALGILQAAFRFCVAYGLLGVFNVGADMNRTDTVEQAASRRRDRWRATWIIALSIVIAFLVSGAICLIPVK
ncbi:hypothetical protein SH668x_002592 [Planctomicrobium sp. SH668]|uniref:hypothetical protein n=1 Tax=Planctomicrobium sp. SH668 TaxID=3448126 RepID=UPI003F5CB79D